MKGWQKQSGGIMQIKVDVSIGELVDKITILMIKEKYIESPDKLKNISHELYLLSSVLRSCITDEHMNEKIIDIKEQLLKVNEDIWNVENVVRECEKQKDFTSVFVTAARNVYILNDKRAALKKDLNESLGSEVVEEKSYDDHPKLSIRDYLDVPWQSS